jgi:hypothetical protein
MSELNFLKMLEIKKNIIISKVGVLEKTFEEKN